MATQPVLGGTTLPYPAIEGLDETIEYRGGNAVMADGSQVTDLVDANAHRTFVLSWRGLTSAQKDTVETALATVKNTTQSYTHIDGDSYTVSADGAATIKWTIYMVGGGALRYDGSVALRST